MQLTMRRTAPDTKSSVEKYQSSVNKELMRIKGKVLFSQKNIIIIVTLLLTEVMTGVYTEDTLKASYC